MKHYPRAGHFCSTAFGDELKGRNTTHTQEEGERMALIDGMLQELEQETQTTRRVLERVPDNQPAWRPHEKARTLGELALHVAMVPGGVAELVASPSPTQAPQFTDPSPKSASTRASRRRRRCSAAWTTPRSWRRGD